MRKTVTCFAAHPYLPQVLLGYESGILEDVSIDDEIGTLVPHTTDDIRHPHGRCAISCVVVGWGNNPVRFTRYLAPHESLAHPLKSLQSTKTSFVPPSPVLRHDLAVAISGCDCSLVDLNLGVVCCTWVLPFYPHCFAVCGPIVATGPLKWSSGASSTEAVLASSSSDWNDRHCLLLDLSCYRAGAMEVVQKVSKEKVDVAQHLSLHGKSMSQEDLDAFFASSCAHLVSTVDKTLRTLVQIEGHSLSPFIAATYTTLVRGELAATSSAPTGNESFDSDISRTLRVEVHRISSKGRSVACCGALRVAEVAALLGGSPASYHTARPIGYRHHHNRDDSVLMPRLAVVLTSGLVILVPDSNHNINDASSSSFNSSIASRRGLDASTKSQSTARLKQVDVPRWVPQQIYRLTTFLNPIATVVRSIADTNVVLTHKNGTTVSLDTRDVTLNNSVESPSSAVISANRIHVLRPRPLSTTSMWRVPSQVFRSLNVSRGTIMSEPVEVCNSTHTAIFGYDSSSNRLTVAPLQRPASFHNFGRAYCNVVTSFGTSDVLLSTFQDVFLTVDIMTTGSRSGSLHECRVHLRRAANNSCCSFSQALPMAEDVQEIDILSVWALVGDPSSPHSLIIVAMVNLFGAGGAPRRQLSGAAKPETALLVMSLPCEQIVFRVPTTARVRRLEGCLAVVRSRTDVVVSAALCGVTGVGWVLLETSEHTMSVRSFSINEFVSNTSRSPAHPRWLAQYQVDSSVTGVTTPTHAWGDSRLHRAPEALILLVHHRLGSIDIVSASTGARRLHYSIPRKAQSADAILGPVVCRQFHGAQALSSLPNAKRIDTWMCLITTHASRQPGSDPTSSSSEPLYDELRVHSANVAHADDSWLVAWPVKDICLYPWLSSHNTPGTRVMRHHALPCITWGPTSNLFFVSALGSRKKLIGWLVESSHGLSVSVNIASCHPLGGEFVHVVWRNAGDDSFEASCVTTVATHVHPALSSSTSISFHDKCLMLRGLKILLPHLRLHAALACTLHPTPLSLRHAQLFLHDEEPDPVTAAQQLLQKCRDIHCRHEVMAAVSLISTFGLCVKWLLQECQVSLTAAVHDGHTTPARWWHNAWANGSSGILFQLLRSVCVGEHDPGIVAMVKTFLSDNSRHQPTTLTSMSRCSIAQWVCCVNAHWWARGVRSEVEEWLIDMTSSVASCGDASRLVFDFVKSDSHVGQAFVSVTFASRDVYGAAAKTLCDNIQTLLPFLESSPILVSPPDPLQRFRRVLDNYVPPAVSSPAAVVNTSAVTMSMEGAFQSNAIHSAFSTQCLVADIEQPIDSQLVAKHRWSWVVPKVVSSSYEVHSDDDPADEIIGAPSIVVSQSTAAEQANLRRQFQQGQSRQEIGGSGDDSDPDFVDTGRYGTIDLRGAILLRGNKNEQPPVAAPSKTDADRVAIPASDALPTTKIYPSKTAKSDRVGVHVSSSFEPLFESLEGKLPAATATVPSLHLMNRLGSAGGGQRPQSSRRIAAELPPPPAAPTEMEHAINSPAAAQAEARAAVSHGKNSVQAHLTSKAVDEMMETAFNAMDVQNFSSALTIFRSVEKSTGGASTEVKPLCRAYRKICTALKSVSRSSDQLSPLQVTNEREARLLAAALVLPETGIRPFHLLLVALPLVEYCVNRNNMWQAAQAAANFSTYLMSTACNDDAWSHKYLLWSHEHENLLGNLTSMCQAVDDYCNLLGGDPPEDENPVVVNILMSEVASAITDKLFEFSD